MILMRAEGSVAAREAAAVEREVAAAEREAAAAARKAAASHHIKAAAAREFRVQSTWPLLTSSLPWCVIMSSRSSYSSTRSPLDRRCSRDRGRRDSLP
jgi:hypothetical protein